MYILLFQQRGLNTDEWKPMITVQHTNLFLDTPTRLHRFLISLVNIRFTYYYYITIYLLVMHQ